MRVREDFERVMEGVENFREDVILLTEFRDSNIEGQGWC